MVYDVGDEIVVQLIAGYSLRVDIYVGKERIGYKGNRNGKVARELGSGEARTKVKMPLAAFN